MLFWRKPRAVIRIRLELADRKDLQAVIEELESCIRQCKDIDFEIEIPNG